MQPRMAGRARPEQLLSLKLELVVPVVAALLLCAAGDVRQAEGGGPQGVQLSFARGCSVHMYGGWKKY